MSDRALTSRQLLLLLAISMAGIALRVSFIDRSYWFDELATLNTIDAPDWFKVLKTTSQDNQPPLYNSLAYAWSHLFGYSEVAIRSLSTVFGLLALLTPWLARTSLSRNGKLLCFAFLCLMPLPIRYAQEARNYSLLFLLSSTCLFCYYELLARQIRRLWTLFHVSLFLLAFSHLFGLLLAVSFLAVMFWRESRMLPRIAYVLYGLALSVAIILPLLHGGSGELAAGNFWITFTPRTLSKQLFMVLTPAGAALTIYAFLRWRRGPERGSIDPRLIYALLPFLLMFVGSVCISFHTPILTDRNLIGLIPAEALLACWLAQSLLDGRGAAGILALLAVMLLQAALFAFSPILFMQQDFRTIAKTSIADDSRVCYVVPAMSKSPPTRIFAYYVAMLYGRPDLAPEVVQLPAVPDAFSRGECRLWSYPMLDKRGSTVLGNLPQFSTCSSVPLVQKRADAGSELYDCRPVASGGTSSQ